MSSNNATSAEAKVKAYLDSFTSNNVHPSIQEFPRVACCKPSQSLYCKECCRLVVPDDVLPAPIRLRKHYFLCGGDGVNAITNLRESCPDHQGSNDRPLRLPFDLHVILDDRRGSSTGIHAVALLGSSFCDSFAARHELSEDKEIHPLYNELGSVKLTDVEKLDPIDQSEILENALEAYDESLVDENNASTYFLFPCRGESVPLQEVSGKVKTLIVLDCKWTKSGVWRRSNRLRNIPKVHLSNPPIISHFWRWHNAGEGMMSTIEAIYYAGLEVYQSKREKLLVDSDVAQSQQLEKSSIDENNLVLLLWLFGRQRMATLEQAKNEGKVAPCCEDGKEMQRALRRRKITWSLK
jgi:hypothetical protein